MKKCPLCGSEFYKVIYYGLPAQLCVNEDCNCMTSVFSFILDRLPFNGMFFVYEGNYFIALWNWLIYEEEV